MARVYFTATILRCESYFLRSTLIIPTLLFSQTLVTSPKSRPVLLMAATADLRPIIDGWQGQRRYIPNFIRPAWKWGYTDYRKARNNLRTCEACFPCASK